MVPPVQLRLMILGLASLILSSSSAPAPSRLSTLPTPTNPELDATVFEAEPQPFSDEPNDEPDASLFLESLPETPVTQETVCPTPTEAQATAQFEAIAHHAAQMAIWLEAPASGLGTLVQTLGPQLLASLTPSPWPSIHQRATLARVPVMMYHDILPEKEVFFDVTPEEFERHLQLIQQNGLTPISLDQLVHHLRTGLPLPQKPILLTFDDGYVGHYDYVYPLLKQYGYPGLFSIYTYKVGREHGRPGVDWEQVREMAADPLVTIAAHSVNHPADLRELADAELQLEIVQSRQVLEQELGIPIRYFTYPEGNYDARVAAAVQEAGYVAALTMDDAENRFAGESFNLLSIDRIGQSQLARVIDRAWGGSEPRLWSNGFDFTTPVQFTQIDVDDVSLSLAAGGRPVTIHANSRYQVYEIVAGTEISAAVDGGFFSMKYLDSNTMIGPVFSQSTGEFVPGNASENPKLTGRPLVLISPDVVQFIPFDPQQHNTLEGIQADMPDVTDAFVGAAWLVKNGKPSTPDAFLGFFDFDANRHRAFWGINQAGQPVVGVSTSRVDSVSLGQLLAQLGLHDVVMLDSGASASLVYEGQPLMDYLPRPVPHVVGLVPPPSDAASDSTSAASTCAIAPQEPPLVHNVK